MQRFIEEQNIARIERLLATEPLSDRSRHLVEEQWLAAQRRLAALSVVGAGLKPGRGIWRGWPHSSPKITGRFHREFATSPMPLLLLDPGPGLRIVEANRAYAAVTMIDAASVAGEKLFDVFPDNPGDPFADGVANLFDSLRIVAETGQPHVMAVQRYDVRGPAGAFVERYWQPLNSPVLNGNGELAFILHRVLDVTAKFRVRHRGYDGKRALRPCQLSRTRPS
jgi:PAS domain-containing protein